MKKGLLIILSGPSGVGKNCVRQEIMKSHRIDLTYSISMTTRKPRDKEVDGVDYYFVSEEEFDRNIENGNLKWNDIVVVSKNAAGMGGSQIFLEANEMMTVEDLVKGICVASGNDATVALAEKIAGTEASFVKLMNDKARKLGLKNTNFVNSTGLDANNHYSSAYDMAVIARELVRHEEVLKFSSIYEDYLRKNTANSFWLVNTNKM